jgi:hypothetical protein
LVINQHGIADSRQNKPPEVFFVRQAGFTDQILCRLIFMKSVYIKINFDSVQENFFGKFLFTVKRAKK